MKNALRLLALVALLLVMPATATPDIPDPVFEETSVADQFCETATPEHRAKLIELDLTGADGYGGIFLNQETGDLEHWSQENQYGDCCWRWWYPGCDGADCFYQPRSREESLKILAERGIAQEAVMKALNQLLAEDRVVQEVVDRAISQALKKAA